MIFEQNKALEKAGEVLGFVFSYFLSTTTLFILLNYVKKYGIPYINIASIILGITIIGLIIKRLLK